MADKTTLGPCYFQLLGEDGKPFVSFSGKGVECATFEPDTFYNRYDYCVVKDIGKCYSGYKAFVKKHCYYRLSDWKENQLPIKDKVYKIVDCAPHEDNKDTIIYIIEDTDTEQIYLIGESGIVKHNLCTGRYNTTMTVDNSVGLDWCHTDTLTTTKRDELYNNYVLGEWDFPIIRKGEIKMRNEVLELYAKREREKIENTFRAMEKEEYNNLEAVKRYNELTNTFKTSLAELVDEYKNEEPKVFVQTVYEDHFGYEVNPYLERQIAEKFQKDFEAEMRELDKRIEEIRAVLSLSNDLEYQKNVLVEYGILNKKGVMVNE